ncbi:MAG: branched-chain amino acid ABC transporter permease [Actinobacteria bacterium HGW-Actinobacteria-4]|nr:MAG: branched-chain amino acid ABC transporter permease [Actinobacteria bacterium HGW-Actinobacteria-4]
MTPPSPAFASIGREQWRDFWAGTRAMTPLMAGSAAFGLAFGALVRTVGIDPWTGTFASVSVAAGASQIAIVDQLRVGAPAVIVVLTALVINARLALYSAALAPVYAAFPRRWKLGLAHIMTDQSAVMTVLHADKWPDPVRRRWFIFGVSGPFVGVWVVGTVAGIALGPVIPEAWQIGFIVPLMFIAVVMPALRTWPALTAALVAVAVVVLTKDLPYGLNVLLGALAGIALGSLVPTKPVPNVGEEEGPGGVETP